MVNLCNFTTRVSGELTKNHHISPLKHVISQLEIANLTKIHRACFTESRMNSIYIQNKKYYKLVRDGAVEEGVDDMQEVRGSNPCMGGEITYFSGEMR